MSNGNWGGKGGNQDSRALLLGNRFSRVSLQRSAVTIHPIQGLFLPCAQLRVHFLRAIPVVVPYASFAADRASELKDLRLVQLITAVATKKNEALCFF